MEIPNVDNRDEMLIRHDERIARLEAQNGDLARIVQEKLGYQEGWWQARRDSLMNDVKADLDARTLKSVRRLGWLAVAAAVTAVGALVKGYLLP